MKLNSRCPSNDKLYGPWLSQDRKDEEVWYGEGHNDHHSKCGASGDIA